MSKINVSPEYQTFKVLEHWKPANEVLLVEELADSKEKLADLFFYFYYRTKQEYSNFPKRKDHTDPFIHPLNLVWNLKKAEVNDYVALCAALMHDLIEEKVDFYKNKNNISEQNNDNIKILDEYENKLFKELEQELQEFFSKSKSEQEAVKEILNIIKLLTRHKRHLYYRSISQIFNCKKPMRKDLAIKIKLVDRIHNIQCLKNFNEQERIYQCFKNFFILNNTKDYLLKKFGQDRVTNGNILPLEKLFKKCCKATYDAFHSVCNDCLKKKIKKVESMLLLAFEKYVHEEKGLWTVGETDDEETHPMNIFHGIIRKYDARLHQEWEELDNIKKKEQNYFKKFFADFNFNDEQIQAIIHYKDALALKEAVATLLYKKNYVISSFGCNELCRRGKVCLKEL